MMMNSVNQKRMLKTNGTLKQTGINEMTKEKRLCKTSRVLSDDKENTPPVASRLRRRKLITVNKNPTETVSSLKAEKQKKTEAKGNFRRTELKPVKGKQAENTRKFLNISPIHPHKTDSKSGSNSASQNLLPVRKEDRLFTNALLPFKETKDDLASVSHILFRRRSSNTFQEEALMLTSENPRLDYWKTLAEQRLGATEKTLHENELMYDQLSVLEAENTQLREALKRAKEMISIIQSCITEDS